MKKGGYATRKSISADRKTANLSVSKTMAELKVRSQKMKLAEQTICKPHKSNAYVRLLDTQNECGLVQVYAGTGKGKTTAAIGLAIRAVGQGLHVYFAQFMKGVSYGELSVLSRMPNITIRQSGSQHWIIPDCRTDEDREVAGRGFDETRKAVFSGKYDIVVMDEINVATAWKLVPVEKVVELIRTKPPTVELVLTGRLARPEIIGLADLVTEMVPVKHPFEKGIHARRGIEF